MRLLSVLVLGSFVSSLGSGMTAFALGVWAFTTFGTASSVALLELAAFTPIVLLAPWAGVVADRHDRPSVMLVGDGGSALGLMLVLVAVTRSVPNLPLVLVSVTCASCVAALTEPALRATVNDLVGSESYARASSLLQLSSSSKYLLAPLLAGFLLPHGGVLTVLCIDAATFLVTLTCTLAVRQAVGVRRPATSTESVSTSLRRTARLLRGDQGVSRVILLTSLLTVALGMLQVLFTPMLLPRYPVSQVGTTMSVAACGMLVGAAAVGAMGRLSPWRMLGGGVLAVGAGMLVIPVATALPAVGAATFLVFAALAVCTAGAEVVVRSRIANDHQGRAWGLISLITQMGFLLAYALAGPLADHVFEPLLLPDGALSPTLGGLLGVGPGQGTALLIGLCGLGALALTPLARRPQEQASSSPSPTAPALTPDPPRM